MMPGLRSAAACEPGRASRGLNDIGIVDESALASKWKKQSDCAKFG